MKRYELEYNGDIYTMEEDEEGEYVRHEDVQQCMQSLYYIFKKGGQPDHETLLYTLLKAFNNIGLEVEE